MAQDGAWARYMLGAPSPTRRPVQPAPDTMANNTAFTVQTLLNTVAQMQESINALTIKLMDQKKYDVPGPPSHG